MEAVPILNRHVWRDGHPVLEIRPAKAFRPHDVAGDTNRHRQSRQVLLGETRTDDLPPLLHGVGPLWQRGRMRHGWHVLRVRVQGRRSGAHVPPKPQNRHGEQPDGQDDQCRPGLRPTLQHVPSTSALRGLSASVAQRESVIAQNDHRQFGLEGWRKARRKSSPYRERS